MLWGNIEFCIADVTCAVFVDVTCTVFADVTCAVQHSTSGGHVKVVCALHENSMWAQYNGPIGNKD